MVVGLLFLSECKTSENSEPDVFDITGNWNFFLLDGVITGTINFSGTEASGTLSADLPLEGGGSGTGTYTVNDPNVTFSITWITTVVSTHSGTVTDNNNMSGNFTMTNGVSGNWTASR
jgi:hypothetical protein